MSMMSGPGGPQRATGENDIYTALAAVGFLFILTATIYVGYRAFDLFGNLLPVGGS